MAFHVNIRLSGQGHFPDDEDDDDDEYRRVKAALDSYMGSPAAHQNDARQGEFLCGACFV
jgi:hypothetical protein